VLAKLIQGDPKQPIYFIMNQFCISKLAFERKVNRLYQASDSARGWKLVMLYLAARPSLCQGQSEA